MKNKTLRYPQWGETSFPLPSLDDFAKSQFGPHHMFFAARDQWNFIKKEGLDTIFPCILMQVWYRFLLKLKSLRHLNKTRRWITDFKEVPNSQGKEQRETGEYQQRDQGLGGSGH
ncbi:MAG: hypothetical protein ACOCS6_01150 [Desulfosalsimonas sp.]